MTLDLPIGQGLARDRTLDCLIRIGLVMDGLIERGKGIRSYKVAMDCDDLIAIYLKCDRCELTCIYEFADWSRIGTLELDLNISQGLALNWWVDNRLIYWSKIDIGLTD